MYKVVLVDDEQIILQGLQRAFPWAEYQCQVVGVASDGREGMALIRKHRPHILLTDIRMPNLDGLGMVAALKSEFPNLQIAVLTGYRDFDYAQRALHLGVCRFLLKPSKMDELKEAFATMTANLAPPAKEPDGAAPRDPEENEAGAFVARAAMKYMKEHCTEHLSLCDVADSVYISQWHLSKLINRYAHQSFFDLLNGYRIRLSKELLSDPARKVNEIAYQVGYSDVAHFSRSFKKVTGQTPMEYRGSLR